MYTYINDFGYMLHVYTHRIENHKVLKMWPSLLVGLSVIAFVTADIKVEIRSEGYYDPGKTGRLSESSIKVNGVEYSTKHRGYNIVVLDDKGDFINSRLFDTHALWGNDYMVKFISDLPAKCIVLVATQEEPAESLKDSGKKALYSIGASRSHPIEDSGSYALIGYKGFNSPQWSKEAMKGRTKGPTVLSATITTGSGPVPPTQVPPPPTNQPPSPPPPAPVTPRPPPPGGACRQSIVGGVEAVPNSWPWMASLSSLAQSGNWHGHFCGGSLVTKYHVVTAAHCVKTTSRYQVRLGDHYRRDTTSVEQTIPVSRVWKHQNYKRKGYRGYDVAVLKLRYPAKITSAVQTIPLDTNQNFPAGKECVVTGWGTTRFKGPSSQKLLQVRVPLRSSAECKKSYWYVGDNEFCAGCPQGGKDSCQGDSGGPFVCMNDQTGVWYLTGIVSWGDGCAKPGKYGVYSQVSDLQTWIQDKLNQ